MNSSLNLDKVYVPSEDVVARDIEGELIIVPLTAGIGDTEDALFTLNEAGRAIWDRLDGTRTLHQVALELAGEYDAPPAQIEADVAGLVEELAKRKMVVEP
jgi:hypothetical protein